MCFFTHPLEKILESNTTFFVDDFKAFWGFLASVFIFFHLVSKKSKIELTKNFHKMVAGSLYRIKVFFCRNGDCIKMLYDAIKIFFPFLTREQLAQLVGQVGI